MDLQTLATYLEGRLNANSKGVTFRTGWLQQSSDTAYEIKTYTNYFTETVATYTPAMFTLVGDPQKIPNQDITNWSIIVEYILTGDFETSADLVKEVEAIDEFRLGIINNPITTLDGYRLALSAAPIVRSSDIKIRGSKKHVVVSMQIDISTGISVYYGNDIVYKLALLNETPEVIFPIKASTINGKTEETETDLTSTSGITTTIARDGTVRYDMSLVFDNSTLHNEIAKGLSAFSGAINTKFDYQEVWLDFNIRKNVIISGGTITKNANDYIILNVQLVVTD